MKFFVLNILLLPPFLVSCQRDGLGVLITGGLSYNQATLKKVELIDFERGTVCNLPKLPDKYFAHTQNTLSTNRALLCGGFIPSTRNVCRQWIKAKGKFSREATHEFRTPWWDHVSFVNDSDFTFVLGGERTSDLTVFLEPGVVNAEPAYNPPWPSRLSCAIYQPETDTVLVTGGRDPTMTLVVQYSNTGPTDNGYPFLQVGRYNHGCTSFSSDSKSFYIVTGGQKNQVDLLDSTEIYDPEANVWTVVASGPFPVKVAGLRLTNIMDKVLAFGGVEERQFGDKFLSSIFQWNIAEKKWDNDELTVKNMADKRSRFGISVVNIEDYEKKCQWYQPN